MPWTPTIVPIVRRTSASGVAGSGPAVSAKRDGRWRDGERLGRGAPRGCDGLGGGAAVNAPASGAVAAASTGAEPLSVGAGAEPERGRRRERVGRRGPGP